MTAMPMLKAMRTDKSIQAWLERRAQAVGGALAADDPSKHKHALGLSVNCRRCCQVLDEYDRVHPFHKRPQI